MLISVVNNEFNELKEGTSVRYVETEGEQGPQASTIQIVHKPASRVAGPDESIEP